MSRLLTTGQAARICSVTSDTVLKWIRSGHLRARRTAGGHHRIDQRDLDQFLTPSNLEEPEQSLPVQDFGSDQETNDHHTQFRYCWEFNGNGKVRSECLNCAAYLLRAHRCYEVAKLAPEAVHARVYCEGSCEDCEYFREVHGQRTNILVITRDGNLTEKLRIDARVADFNLELVDCEYNCSAVVNHFRPDFVIVDCDLGPNTTKDISYHLIQDPRIPFVRVILAGNRESFPTECDKEVFARMERPFDIRDIAECIENLRSGGRNQGDGSANLDTAGQVISGQQ